MSKSCIDFPNMSSPFPFAGANNGLSVDSISGAVVLGNDVGGVLATLLSNREIPLAGFSINFTEAGGVTTVSIFGAAIFASDTAAGTIGQLSNNGEIQLLGDSSLGQNNPGIKMTDLVGGGMWTVKNEVGVLKARYTDLFFISSNYLSFDPANGLFSIGDLDPVGNGLKLDINDLANVAYIKNAVGFGLVLDFSTLAFIMGAFGFGNNTTIEVQDSLQIVNVNAVNGLHIVGDTTLIHSGTALANGAGGATATLTNAPTAGNATKWIPIDDNGTIRYVPSWL